MAYTGRTLELAYRHMQRDMLNRIITIAYEGGAEVGTDPDSWKLGVSPITGDYLWVDPGERPLILFAPLQFAKFDRVQVSATPLGEQKSEYAFLDSFSNGFDIPASYSQTGGVSETIHVEEANSETYGWGLSVTTEGQVGGGESSGGSYFKIGVTASAHGEYAKSTLESKENTQQSGRTLQIDLPPFTMGKIMQAVQKGKVKVRFADRMVVDPSFFVVAWRHPRKGHDREGKPFFLSGNRDWSRWYHSKSCYVWKVQDIIDMETQLSGQDPRYPSAQGRDLIHQNHTIGEAWAWLHDENHRTIEVDQTVIFDKSQFGDISLTGQKSYHDGDVVEEK